MMKVFVRAFAAAVLLSLSCFAETDSASASSDSKWKDRLYFAIDFKSIPFDFSTEGFKSEYFDGTDHYPLSFDTLKISSASKIGLLVNSKLYNPGSFRSDLEIGLHFVTADKLYGGDVDLRTLNGFMIGKRFFLTSRLGIGGGIIKGAVSKVGKGDVSGADFMLGPKGERIPEGNEISLSATTVTLTAGLGLQIDLFSRVYADVFGDYVIYGNGGDWELVADDDGGNSVTLDRDSFSNIANLKDVDLGGVSFGLALGWRL